MMRFKTDRWQSYAEFRFTLNNKLKNDAFEIGASRPVCMVFNLYMLVNLTDRNKYCS